MGIAVLGPLLVDHGSAPLGNRERIVLAALVARVGQVVTPDELADAVWGERPPATWHKSLQGCVSRIRRALGEGCIETTTQGYRLALSADALDAGRFERLFTRAEEFLRLGEADRAAFTAAQALALWRGRPLAELDDWQPGVAEAGRLTQVRLAAEELHLDALLRSGDGHDVVAMAQVLVEAAPSRERRWSLCALAQYRAGDQTEALHTLRRLRAFLVEELGVEPGPDVLALQQAILRQDPALLLDQASVPASDECPYRGLRAYEESDADSFFGREDEVARCLAQLEERGVLAVVGPSGIGKSSLVRAGVATALARLGCEVQVVVPGRHPMTALDALGPRDVRRSASAAGSHVLVVDQAEELYVVCEDPAERRRFVDAVIGHAPASLVVVALRADHTGDLLGDPEFARLVERGLFLLGGMTEAGLRAAMENPARQSGLILEPGLVDLLVREVEGEPGALPMLSHVLRETWLRREGRTLTVSGYRASGGIRGAVAQSAEDLFSRVPVEEQQLLRELMLRLVVPGVEGNPVPARLPRRLVVADPAHDRLVDLLVAARLVTSDAGVVVIAHESLTRAWPRLREWLEEDVEGRRTLHHLVTAADAWEDLGRPHSELYRGIRLSRAAAWREDAAPELTTVEGDFLDASAATAADEERAAQERVRVQDRMIRRLRTSLAGVAVLLVLALSAGAIALVQNARARESAQTATAAETRAVARRVGAQALLTDDIPKALLLAVAAARLDPSPGAQAQLQQVLAAYPNLIRVGYGGESAFGRLAVSADGRTVAAHATDGTVWLYDARTLATRSVAPVGAEVEVFPGSPLQFSPDGSELAAGASPTAGDLPVQLLDPGTSGAPALAAGGMAQGHDSSKWRRLQRRRSTGCRERRPSQSGIERGRTRRHRRRAAQRAAGLGPVPPGGTDRPVAAARHPGRAAEP